MSLFKPDIYMMLLSVPGIIIGLVFHEFAHALASDKLGDPTPRNMGRLTLNPLAHLDPIGTILILIARFGWAKPVPINTSYYKKPRRDEILVSVAGPLMNLLLAVFFTLMLKLYLNVSPNLNIASDLNINIQLLFSSTIYINVMLSIFNLLPLPPLDGFHILTNILSYKYYKFLAQLEQYSMIILILLIATNITSIIVGKPAEALFNLLIRLVD